MGLICRNCQASLKDFTYTADCTLFMGVRPPSPAPHPENNNTYTFCPWYWERERKKVNSTQLAAIISLLTLHETLLHLGSLSWKIFSWRKIKEKRMNTCESQLLSVAIKAESPLPRYITHNHWQSQNHLTLTRT